MSEVDKLPFQPMDGEIEEKARQATLSCNWASLEQYLFSEYLSPSWVFYMAISEACRHAKSDQISHLERIVQRAIEELGDCPELLAHTIGIVEDLARDLGNRPAMARFIILRYKVYAQARAMGLEAPEL
jgi:hypothetical protein